MSMGMGMGFMFDIFPVLFFIVFAVIIVVFLVILVQGVGQWRKNNASPVLTVEAEIVSRRADVSHHHHSNTGNTRGMHTSSSTTYYVTFQVESGDRLELHIPRNEYGMLVERDRGRLTFQGTRYLGFERGR